MTSGPPAPPDSNRRTFTRVALPQPVVFVFDGGHSFRRAGVDISAKGLAFRSREQLCEGEECTLRIPLGCRDEDPEIEARGVVARSEHGEIGVEFKAIDFTSFDLLLDFIRGHAADAAQVEEEFRRRLGPMRGD